MRCVFAIFSSIATKLVNSVISLWGRATASMSCFTSSTFRPNAFSSINAATFFLAQAVATPRC